MQASLFVQVRKVNNAHAVAQQNDVTVASFHGSKQTIRMISDVVRPIVCDFTLVDLTQIYRQMPTTREKKNNFVLEILK